MFYFESILSLKKNVLFTIHSGTIWNKIYFKPMHSGNNNCLYASYESYSTLSNTCVSLGHQKKNMLSYYETISQCVVLFFFYWEKMWSEWILSWKELKLWCQTPSYKSHHLCHPWPRRDSFAMKNYIHKRQKLKIRINI